MLVGINFPALAAAYWNADHAAVALAFDTSCGNFLAAGEAFGTATGCDELEPGSDNVMKSPDEMDEMDTLSGTEPLSGMDAFDELAPIVDISLARPTDWNSLWSMAATSEIAATSTELFGMIQS